MKQLAQYVNAIVNPGHEPAPSSHLVEKTSWEDQGFEVTKEIKLHSFADGVVIRCTIEQDNFPSELACAECWITYEVVSNGSGGAINPSRKVFENECRQAFWLSYYAS